MLFLLLLLSTAHAGEPLQVTEAQTKALVNSIRGRELSIEQHDLLVGLGDEAKDATPGDKLYVGWALVFADRPDLGIPLVRVGLGQSKLDASTGLRTLIFAETAGQDGLVRATLELLKRESPTGARRLEQSVRLPESFAVAAKKAKRATKDLEVGTFDVPFSAGEQRRVVWFVRPSESRGAVIWLPDGGGAEGLPTVCQDSHRLKEAAALAHEGWSVYLPGLRGCDHSDGAYAGAKDAAKDLSAMLPMVRERESGEVVLMGLEEGGLLAVRVADSVDVDRVVAWQPTDPGDTLHIPDAVVAQRDVPSKPSTPVMVALPYPALAQVLGAEAVEIVPLPRRQRVQRALEILNSADSAPDR